MGILGFLMQELRCEGLAAIYLDKITRLNGLHRGEECIGPKAKEADLWTERR